jgi:organic hydroperoxide reductase OsmC/OhrA
MLHARGYAKPEIVSAGGLFTPGFSCAMKATGSNRHGHATCANWKPVQFIQSDQERPSMITNGAPAGKELDLAESVAGEEDPGASIELAPVSASPGRSDQSVDHGVNEPSGPAGLYKQRPAGDTDGLDFAQAPSMAHYTVQVLWQRGGHEFVGNRYSRRHLIRFDGGAEVMGSSSPHVVPVPQSDPAGVDPEEAFVASLSSCHMLWFLSLAARAGFCVERYTDNAQGVMARNAAGKMAMTEVTLHPEVLFSGSKGPTREQLAELHHEAHEECFIANSVTTDVRCEPVYPEP